MEMVFVYLYLISISIICLFAAIQLYLVIQYRKSNHSISVTQELDNFPFVTIQLPVYNEKFVVQRLIEAVAALDYPKDRFEIQVLDDSDDETSSIISESINHIKKNGITAIHLQRESRQGFKAGALQYGLDMAQGDFIAIFDADFVPKPDFLKQTLHCFEDHIGMVQTRWDHLNKDYNLLTRMQAFALDAHFTVEQSGRSRSGRFINFNGTAGIWRKKCIDEAGGWKSNTLTEDLDLSYRAQLKGWKFIYLENTTSPAELPTIVPSIKSQQYRWNKGAAETARLSIPNILSSRLSLGTKIHGIAHLMNSSIFIWLLIAAISSVPLLIAKNSFSGLWIWDWSIIFLFGFFVIALFYWTAARGVNPTASVSRFIKDFPAFLALTSGLSLHNSIAVSEGYLGIKSPFIRTPKFNLKEKESLISGNDYLKFNFSPVTILEGLLSIYFVAGIILGVTLEEYGFILWHMILAFGFGFVFYRSVIPVSR